MPKLTYYKLDEEPVVKVKDLIIFLDEISDDFEYRSGQERMLFALKGYFKRLLTGKRRPAKL